MSIFHLILSLYIAAVLGVSGLSKVSEPVEFAEALQQQRLLPPWSIPAVGCVLPWLEIAIAGVLAMGLIPLPTAALVLTLFLCFLTTKIILLMTGRAAQCGCFGSASSKNIDGASIVAAIVFVFLSTILLWSSFEASPIGWQWHVFAATLFYILGAWLLLRTISRRRHFVRYVMPPREYKTLKIGSPPPTLTLPDLTGKILTLADFRGRPTIVLFWNPHCSYCARILKDLKTWESNPPLAAPQLLIVSLGTAEENYAQGFRSPIVLDENLNVRQAFGMTGTPTAALISADGDKISGIGIGTTEVLQLVIRRM